MMERTTQSTAGHKQASGEARTAERYAGAESSTPRASQQTAPHSFKLPDELEQRLIQAAESETQSLWEYGACAAEAVDNIPLRASDGQPAIPLEIVRERVGDLIGKAAETVRKYEEVWRFYPEHVQEAFPNLTWNHFRTAKAAGSLTAAQRWLQIARDHAELDESGGRPLSVRRLAAMMKDTQDGRDPFAEPSLFDELDALRWKVQRVQERQEMPGPVRLLVSKALDLVGQALVLLDEDRARQELPEELLDEVSEVARQGGEMEE